MMLWPCLPPRGGAGGSAAWRHQPIGKQQELING